MKIWGENCIECIIFYLLQLNHKIFHILFEHNPVARRLFCHLYAYTNSYYEAVKYQIVCEAVKYQIVYTSNSLILTRVSQLLQLITMNKEHIKGNGMLQSIREGK